MPRCSPICSATLVSWSTDAQAVVSDSVLCMYESCLGCSECGAWTDLQTPLAVCRSTPMRNKKHSGDQNFLHLTGKIQLMKHLRCCYSSEKKVYNVTVFSSKRCLMCFKPSVLIYLFTAVMKHGENPLQNTLTC